MQDAIKQMHTDESGNISSVRVIGSLTAVVGLLLAILASFEVGEAAKVFGTVLASSVSLFALGQGKSGYVSGQRMASLSTTTTTTVPPATTPDPAPQPTASDKQSALDGATGGGNNGKSA